MPEEKLHSQISFGSLLMLRNGGYYGNFQMQHLRCRL